MLQTLPDAEVMRCVRRKPDRPKVGLREGRAGDRVARS